MVKLVEVEDESLDAKNAEQSDNDDDYYTDTDSEISSDDDISDDETLADRFFALRDIIPPQTRFYVSQKIDKMSFWVKSGVPWALAFAEEQQMIEMEKEMKMREAGGELLSGPSTANAENVQIDGLQKKAVL